MRLSPPLRLLPAELDSAADTLVDDLIGWDVSRFMAALQEHRRRSNYVPTTCDLTRADVAVRANRRTNEPIPLPPGPDEVAAICAYQKGKIQGLLQKLGGKIRMPA